MAGRRRISQTFLLLFSLVALFFGACTLAMGLGAHFAQDAIASVIGAMLAAAFDGIWVFMAIDGAIMFFAGATGIRASGSPRSGLPCTLLSMVMFAMSIFVTHRAGLNIIDTIMHPAENPYQFGNMLFSLLMALSAIMVYFGRKE